MARETQPDDTPIYDKAAQEYREKNEVGPAAHVRHLNIEISNRNAKLNEY